MKKQLPNTLPAMVGVLSGICLVAGLLISLVYNLTKDQIAASELIKKVEAIAAVAPDFDNDPLDSALVAKSDPAVVIYTATAGEETVGWAVETYSDKGYSDRIVVFVGFDIKMNLAGLRVLSQSETPGLGTRIAEPAFQKQFIGRNPRDFVLKVKKDGGDVDAITAATISSRAFADAVLRAYETLVREVLPNREESL